MSFSSDQPLVANQLSDTEYPLDLEGFQETFQRENKKVIDAVNSKEGALYLLQELATFQKYFVSGNPQITRNVYRITINFGSLPASATTTVAHNITFDANTRLTRLYGAATDPVNFLYKPLPYASTTLVNNIILEADQTNISITTGIDYSAYTNVTVVMEYTKG